MKPSHGRPSGPRGRQPHVKPTRASRPDHDGPPTGDGKSLAGVRPARPAKVVNRVSAAATRPARATAAPDGEERLQKLIARAGLASRRAAEELILQGRVSVNGKVVKELGVKAHPDRDTITIGGKRLTLPAGDATVVLLHKPKGAVTTKDDPQGRTTILQLLPSRYRHLHPVGRLDYDTSGVLLLTDDGELTHLLTHPSHGIEKVYLARVRGTVSAETLRRLQSGVVLEEETGPRKTGPCKVRVKARTERNSLLEITLREGRYRQVRRMMEAVGHPVAALRRVKFAGLELEGLLPARHRLLLPVEVQHLRKETEKAVRQQAAAETVKPAPTRAPRTPRRPPLARKIERRWSESG